ncbi:hypothetical protein K438DRAFT_2022126 [Mycena galopus ATCC 62051]|nr:hypothetical protein K438DRAFT_2022126 [Mycena galopus ATCC 62051]
MALRFTSATRGFSGVKTMSRWTTRRFSLQTTEDGGTGLGGHLISTLNPALLVPSDYLNLSGLKSAVVCFPKSPQSPRTSFRVARGSIRYHARNAYMPFPPESFGFLHYHRARDAAKLEGSIRFRVTSQNTLSAFHAGHDLLLPSGLPWQIILPQVACRTRYSRFCDQLLEENLATVAQLLQCLKVFSDRGRIYSETILFRLNQEFLVKFSGDTKLTAVGETLHSFVFDPGFRAGADRRQFPWTGSGLARFEPSTSAEHRGRRVVHIRITRIIDPVSSTGKGAEKQVLKPTEGGLMAYSRYGRAPEPWAYDIDAKDSSVATALRALWDNSRIL